MLARFASRRPAIAPHRRPWLAGATLAAAATLGALVGFGLADGASLSRLSTVILRLRGLPEFVTPDRHDVPAALAGGAFAVVASGWWGAALTTLAVALRRRLGPRGAAVALAAAALGVALVDGVLPTPLRLAAGAFARAERVLAALLIAAAGWAGARVADADDA